MARKHRQSEESQKAAWAQHNLEQLLYFRSLTLRQKLEAVEGMCDISRRFQQMRKEGKFNRLHNEEKQNKRADNL